MATYFVYGLGFFAQALFASRMIMQWIQSEKAGRVISPTLFWQTSLVASFLLILYGILRHDLIIISGQILSYFIYIRNLQLKNAWRKIPMVFRLLVFILPVLLFIGVMTQREELLVRLNANNNFSHPLVLVGAAGQLLLNFRFVYQWYFSEKLHRSVFPKGFWIISLAGSVLIILYAVYRMDPVLLVAQTLGFVIYSRNIILGKNNSVE